MAISPSNMTDSTDVPARSTRLVRVRSRRASMLGRALALGMAGTAGLCGLGWMTLSTAPATARPPEPDPVPRRWELSLDVGPMRVITIDVPGLGARKYLYLTYTVVNDSKQDVLLAPAFDLSLGRGEVIRGGRDVPQAVTSRVIAGLQDMLVQDSVGIIGEIGQGKENARRGVVIWPVTNYNPEQIVVYAAGFSGETKTVVSPDGKERYVLRKTARLEFRAPGELTGVGSMELELAGRSWIMR